MLALSLTVFADHSSWLNVLNAQIEPHKAACNEYRQVVSPASVYELNTQFVTFHVIVNSNLVVVQQQHLLCLVFLVSTA